MKMYKHGLPLLLLAIMHMLLPLTAYADDTDLVVPPETISLWAYYSAALTDRYGLELLTEESYEQARAIAEKQERDYHAAQASLFSTREETKAPPLQLAEQLGLFGRDYEANQISARAQESGGSLWLVAGLLVFGTVGGCALAVVLQKRKR